MNRAIIFIIFAVVTLIIFIMYRGAKKGAKNTSNPISMQRSFQESERYLRIATTIGVVITLVLGFISTITLIDANTAGVEVLFGKPRATHTEGLHFKHPLASVTQVPGLQQETTYSNTVGEGDKDGPDAIEAITADNAVVDVDASILWSLDLQGQAPIFIYREYRELSQVRQRLIRPVTRNIIRNCIARYAFEEARTSDREAISNCSRAGIIAEVANFGVIVRDVQIRNMSARSADLQAGIDRKLQAEQAAREAEFRRDQAAIDAETARIHAEGVANAEIERAKGIAEANRLVDESLTPTLLSYRGLEFLSNAGNTTWIIGDRVTIPELVIPVGDDITQP